MKEFGPVGNLEVIFFKNFWFFHKILIFGSVKYTLFVLPSWKFAHTIFDVLSTTLQSFNRFQIVVHEISWNAVPYPRQNCSKNGCQVPSKHPLWNVIAPWLAQKPSRFSKYRYVWSQKQFQTFFTVKVVPHAPYCLDYTIDLCSFTSP